ncbi:MAG: sodium:calcium antiporter [Thermoplasmataceae archaeon]
MKYLSRNSYALLILAGLLLIFYFEISRESLLITGLGIILSLLGLEVGSDFFVEQSISAGTKFNLSGRVVGSVILSIGASIDELFLSLTAAFEKLGEISIGNIQGSNLFTFVVFLLLAPVALKNSPSKFRIETILLVVAYLILSIFAYTEIASVYVGIALLSIFVIYLYALSSGRASKPSVEITVFRFSWIYLFFGVFLLFLSSYELVRVVDSLAAYLHLSLFTSGFVFAGLTGSVPEIFIFASAMRKKQGEISTGVIFGSTLYKVCLVLGLSMVITTIALKPAILTYYAMIALLALSIPILFLSRNRERPATA